MMANMQNKLTLGTNISQKIIYDASDFELEYDFFFFHFY